MALHVCRDFKSWASPTNLYLPYMVSYYLAIFCKVTLGYTTVGQTNFNIDASPMRLGGGTNGSLNQGPSADVYAFAPNGYTVSTADVTRILCLKSPANGMVNSGLFRVVAVDTTRNFLYVDYRSPDIPPPETGMTWGLYENENTWNGITNANGNGITGTYTSQGSATCSRLIIQSPSSLAWQFRICLDSQYDGAFQGGAVSPHGYLGTGAVTMAPGYNGNSSGDFQVGGQHLHAPLFFNVHNTDYTGLSVAWFPSGNGQTRNYMWGDDVTGTVYAASRAVFGGTDSFCHFGLSENENQPLPPFPVQRLFCMGTNGTGNFGNSGIYWACGTMQNTARGGVSFGLSGQPISCIYSLYNAIAGNTFSGGGAFNQALRWAGDAMDNPLTHHVELLPVDLLAGTLDYLNFNGGPEVFILEHRRLGTAPFVRMGPARLGYFQTTTDANRTWLHLDDGFYLPWQGSILS